LAIKAEMQIRLVKRRSNDHCSATFLVACISLISKATKMAGYQPFILFLCIIMEMHCHRRTNGAYELRISSLTDHLAHTDRLIWKPDANMS